MPASTRFSPEASGPVLSRLAPVMAVVLLAFLVIGVAMPVLPLHVHNGLGLSTFFVGLVAGSQFAASLVSRPWAGHFADARGVKRAVVVGLATAAVSGTLYVGSLAVVGNPALSGGILLLGRGLLGGAESFIITGALGWSLALGGPQNSGKVMAWVGAAMYGAFAGGAPLGTMLYERHGFMAVALATALLPLATLAFVLPMKSVPPSGGDRPAVGKVFRAVWLPGMGLALSSLGFGAITGFIALLFAARGWAPLWPAFTAFAAAFILARAVLGHLPDKLGGATVALSSVVVEAAGQALIWYAPDQAVALVGTVLTGLGYSLVYPAFGVEAIRRVPAQSRSLAMGAYTAFLDLALAVGSPALGWVAGAKGVGTVFLASAGVILCSCAAAAALMKAQARPGEASG